MVPVQGVKWKGMKGALNIPGMPSPPSHCLEPRIETHHNSDPLPYRWVQEPIRVHSDSPNNGILQVRKQSRRFYNRILLRDVLSAPSMGVTLVSVNRIARSGATVVFSAEECRVVRDDGDVRAVIPAAGGLYRVRISRREVVALAEDKREMSVDELHRVLGHVSPDVARASVARGMVEGVS